MVGSPSTKVVPLGGPNDVHHSLSAMGTFWGTSPVTLLTPVIAERNGKNRKACGTLTTTAMLQR